MVRSYGYFALITSRIPLDVQRQMGDTTLHLTNNYASLTIDRLRKSYERHSPLRADTSSGTETLALVIGMSS
jgi:hypothetical protein